MTNPKLSLSHFGVELNHRCPEDGNEGGSEDDLYANLKPALCRVLPSLTPETETDVHDYSLKNLTETVHKWKASNFADNILVPIYMQG